MDWERVVEGCCWGTGQEARPTARPTARFTVGEGPSDLASRARVRSHREPEPRG